MTLSMGSKDLRGSGKKSQSFKIVGRIDGLYFWRRLMKMMTKIRAAMGIRMMYMATGPARDNAKTMAGKMKNMRRR